MVGGATLVHHGRLRHVVACSRARVSPFGNEGFPSSCPAPPDSRTANARVYLDHLSERAPSRFHAVR